MLERTDKREGGSIYSKVIENIALFAVGFFFLPYLLWNAWRVVRNAKRLEQEQQELECWISPWK